MAIIQTLRGADVKVFINNKLFKNATGITFSMSTGRHEIRGVDYDHPFELAPGPQTVKGTIELVRKRNSGGLEGQGVSPPSTKVLREKYFTIAVIDRVTDTVIMYVEEAAVVEQNWTVSQRGLYTGTFSFVGIGWANEADT